GSILERDYWQRRVKRAPDSRWLRLLFGSHLLLSDGSRGDKLLHYRCDSGVPDDSTVPQTIGRPDCRARYGPLNGRHRLIGYLAIVTGVHQQRGGSVARHQPRYIQVPGGPPDFAFHMADESLRAAGRQAHITAKCDQRVVQARRGRDQRVAPQIRPCFPSNRQRNRTHGVANGAITRPQLPVCGDNRLGEGYRTGLLTLRLAMKWCIDGDHLTATRDQRRRQPVHLGSAAFPTMH